MVSIMSNCATILIDIVDLTDESEELELELFSIGMALERVDSALAKLGSQASASG